MLKNIFTATLLFAGCWGEALYSQAKGADTASVLAVNIAQLKQIIRNDSGQVVLVNAWATWCKPCKEEIPDLLKLKKNYKGFRFILVSADDIDQRDTVVQPMLKAFGIDFPTYIINDSTEEAFIAGINPGWSGALPTSFLYDRDGRLVDMMVGERTYPQFEKAITGLIKTPHH